MALIPLQLPPGVHRNGTDFESSNRWRDSNLVRWSDGSLRPVGGWDTRKASATASVPRALHAWVDNSGASAMVAGTHNKLIYLFSFLFSCCNGNHWNATKLHCISRCIQ